MLKDTDQVIISGRRWFDKKNGNTYHSCRVFVNGELVGYVPFLYGYGDSWEETGKQTIANHCGFKNAWEVEQYKREHRNQFTFIVSDVARKKDL